MDCVRRVFQLSSFIAAFMRVNRTIPERSMHHNQPDDLRKAGEVARFEYPLFRWVCRPIRLTSRFNDKPNALKYGKQVQI
jgi:hypothetical protein